MSNVQCLSIITARATFVFNIHPMEVNSFLEGGEGLSGSQPHCIHWRGWQGLGPNYSPLSQEQIITMAVDAMLCRIYHPGSCQTFLCGSAGCGAMKSMRSWRGGKSYPAMIPPLFNRRDHAEGAGEGRACFSILLCVEVK
jgi:hypothetical protein